MSKVIQSPVASSIPYDNTTSGLTSQDVKAALDELQANKQPLDADLTSIAAQSGTGLLARTAANTWTTRTITGTSPIVVANGDGVAGNPSLSHANSGVSAGSYGSALAIPVLTINDQGHITAATTATPVTATVYQSNSASDATTSSTTFQTTSVSITPVAGNYIIMANANLSSAVSGINNSGEIALFKNATQITESTQQARIRLAGISLASVGHTIGVSSLAVVTANGTDAFTLRYRRIVGSDVTIGIRNMVMLRYS